MRFKLDENLPESLVADLTAAGHDAATVVQEKTCRDHRPDPCRARRLRKSVFLPHSISTSPTFAVTRPVRHSGIVIFRPRSQDIACCQAAFARLLTNVAEVDIVGNLVVVEDRRIRIRRSEWTKFD